MANTSSVKDGNKISGENILTAPNIILLKFLWMIVMELKCFTLIFPT